MLLSMIIWKLNSKEVCPELGDHSENIRPEWIMTPRRLSLSDVSDIQQQYVQT